MQLDPVIGLGEPDQEVQDLLKASGGLNLGMDFLPGSLGFDPLAFEVDPAEAGRVVWFDALINNVDRSWRNPNMLVWHGDLWLIDHGAAMIWHHNWPSAADGRRPSPTTPPTTRSPPSSPDIPRPPPPNSAPQVTEELLTEVAAEVPDEWLVDEPGFDTPDELRRAYVKTLLARAPDVQRPHHHRRRHQGRGPPGHRSGWRRSRGGRGKCSGLHDRRDVFEYALVRWCRGSSAAR